MLLCKCRLLGSNLPWIKASSSSILALLITAMPELEWWQLQETIKIHSDMKETNPQEKSRNRLCCVMFIYPGKHKAKTPLSDTPTPLWVFISWGLTVEHVLSFECQTLRKSDFHKISFSLHYRHIHSKKNWLHNLHFATCYLCIKHL